MSQRYQTGHLRRAGRKSGPNVWEFLWRETDETGKRVHRTAIVGTIEQYPTEDLAWTAYRSFRGRWLALSRDKDDLSLFSG